MTGLNFKKDSAINNILDILLEGNSSDMHIWTEEIFLRNKIWELEKLEQSLDTENILWFAKHILSSEKFNLLSEWNEVDFGYEYKSNRFRLNFYYDHNWINIAIRKLATKIPELKQLWLPDYLKPYYLKQKWLILVTGPTGSGKSTTLASIVKYINDNKKCHIITLEDPIEYVIKSNKSMIHQREVWNNTKSRMDWIKYALRQDPDVIVVWEMRDLETIEAVLTLVETWHLVISTLHTIDAVQTITRIINSFNEQDESKIAIQLSMALELVISQRLLPLKDWKWKYCSREILINNSAIANLIRLNKIPNIYGIIETQRKIWMTTMDQNLAKVVAKWIISQDDALTVIKNKENFLQMINFYKEA